MYSFGYEAGAMPNHNTDDRTWGIFLLSYYPNPKPTSHRPVSPFTPYHPGDHIQMILLRILGWAVLIIYITFILACWLIKSRWRSYLFLTDFLPAFNECFKYVFVRQQKIQKYTSGFFKIPKNWMRLFCFSDFYTVSNSCLMVVNSSCALNGLVMYLLAPITVVLSFLFNSWSIAVSIITGMPLVAGSFLIA